MTPDLNPTPHITVIVGSAGLRLLLATFIQCRWPNARVEEIDPFSQTMPGAGISPSFGTVSDLVVLGGIGTESEALSSLKRLRAKKHCPPILLIVSPLLLASSALFLAAGANHVLNRESLSANRLMTAMSAELNGGEAVSTMPSPAGPVVDSASTIALHINGQSHSLHFSGYQDLASLASTPLAQVLSARDRATGERVIIKVATIAPLHDLAALAAVCDRLVFFAACGSPHLIRFLDFGLVTSWPYSVMEHLSGGDLREKITAGITPNDAISHLQRLCLALQRLHAASIAHMDVKPENIFFRSDGTLVLIDYNISVRFGTTARDLINEDVLGSPTYMSPEQGQGFKVDGRSDLYSAGVILFEMLAGSAPFQGENAAQVLYRHIHDEVPLLPKRVRRLQTLVDQLLEKIPNHRLPTVESLIAALAPWGSATQFANDD